MNRNGVITIRFEEGGKTPGPQPVDPVNPTPDAEKVTDNNLLETAVLGALLHKTASQVKNMAINEAKYQINKYFMLTNDYLGQQSMNIALNVINKALDFGTTIYFGAKMGAKAGPAGAIAGVVLAAGVSIISTVQQISHNYEQERIKLNQMDAQLQFNRQRAGYSLTAGSIGENR